MLNDGVERVEGAVAGLGGIVEGHVDHALNVDSDVVAGDGRLGIDVESPLPHVDAVGDVVDEGNGEVEAGVLDGVKLAEALDDLDLALGNDVEDGVRPPDGPGEVVGVVAVVRGAEGVESVRAGVGGSKGSKGRGSGGDGAGKGAGSQP